jgi:hypothetical protein
MDIPRFHDGSLYGLITTDSRKCTILLGDKTANRFHLILEGVETLRADNFREGNIILDVTTITSTSIKEDFVRELYQIPTGQDEFIRNTLLRIHHQQLKMFTISASFGCSMLALCTRVECLSGWPNGLE